jgi:5-methylcytosine-specific restriction endonuclease McrA
MPLFKDISLTDQDFFRAVVLYGRNVASYKFALAESLISLASKGKNYVPLEDLAVPFSNALCRHLDIQDKQTTNLSNSFLDKLRAFNRGEISAQEKIDSTVRDGFRYVLDAFHVVGGKEVPVRFYRAERKSSQPAIRLTDELLSMSAATESKDLIRENESRWRMVETAWAYNIPQRLITLDYESRLEDFFTIDSNERHHSVTNARHALNGYQRGKCFYCNREIHLEDWLLLKQRGEVDHFFPHVLKRRGVIEADLDQAWNLVLACNECNGSGEKSALCPDELYVNDLIQRNEYLVSSHHPLRESIMFRTGNTPQKRIAFLSSCYQSALLVSGGHTWKAETIGDSQ